MPGTPHSFAAGRIGAAATILSLIGSLLAVVVAVPAASAAELCSANIVVSRVGDGASALTSAGAAVFLDEYTRAGAFVQAIPLPTTPVGANRPLVNSGTATSNLGLALSGDGRFLTVAGYDAGVGTAGVANTTAAAVPRVAARIDGNGVVDTTTHLGDAFSGDNVRSAVTDDGSRFWLGGAAGGVRFAALGATSSNPVSTTNLNMRWVTIQGGQLYVSSGSAANTGLNQVGTGLPTSSGQVATRVIDTTNAGANSSSPYGAVLLDRIPAVVGFDTAYVADDQGASAGGLRKYSFDGTQWTARGRIAATLRGIAGVGDPASAALWVTTTNNLVQTLTDTAAFDAPITGSLATIVTGAANTAIRGIALAPSTGANCGAVAPTITDEPDSTTIASGSAATLGVAASGTGPLSYQWYVGTSGHTANPVGGATGTSFTTPPLTSTTSYWVRVSNATGTDDSQAATVTVTAVGNTPPTASSPPPLADADADPTGPSASVTVADAETPAGFAFGDAGGIPVAGDFDGDGTDDVAVYRASRWQVRLSTGAVLPTFTFGPSAKGQAATPVAGDWDGDGTDGIGTFTTATGTWSLNQTADGSAADVGPFVFWAGAGTASTAVVGDWNGDGIDTVGVRSAGSSWSLNNANDSSPADVPIFTFGAANALPLTWRHL